MPRGPATNPIPKLPTWQKRPICGECGQKIRRPRPEKICSRCKELLDITEFPHNAAKSDHRESYDRVCKRIIQNEINRNRRLRGKAQPISDLSPVSEQTTTLIGTFVSQGLLSERREVPSSITPVQVQYQTIDDRTPVYELVLMPTDRPTGTPADSVQIAHTFKELFDALVAPGDWLAIVFQDGQVEKVIRAGDEGPIIDTSLDFTEDEDAPLGARFGSYAPARPWSLGVGRGVHLGRRTSEGERLSALRERTGRHRGLHVVLSFVHPWFAVLS